MSRKLIICLDGTGNEVEKNETTFSGFISV